MKSRPTSNAHPPRTENTCAQACRTLAPHRTPRCLAPPLRSFPAPFLTLAHPAPPIYTLAFTHAHMAIAAACPTFIERVEPR